MLHIVLRIIIKSIIIIQLNFLYQYLLKELNNLNFKSFYLRKILYTTKNPII
jgi:hypothetical protein